MRSFVRKQCLRGCRRIRRGIFAVASAVRVPGGIARKPGADVLHRMFEHVHHALRQGQIQRTRMFDGRLLLNSVIRRRRLLVGRRGESEVTAENSADGERGCLDEVTRPIAKEVGHAFVNLTPVGRNCRSFVRFAITAHPCAA